VIVNEVDCQIDAHMSSIDADVFRSPGVHVGAVISFIEKTQGRLKGRDDVDDNNAEKWKPYRTAGFLIERVFRELHKELGLVKIGEICRDGIYMTPDFLDATNWILHEYKCTWRSWKDDIEEFWAWITQIKCYCYALGCLKARLTVFFVNGNYKPRVPMFKSFELTFEQWELDENWAMIRNWSKDLPQEAKE
jgi:hypothetical protein